MAVNTDRLTYRFFTESDNWSAVVDKLNFNFDQTKAYGGGDKGDEGNDGIRGLPGATGIGKPGNKGDKGATIAFIQVALVDGQPVSDPNAKEGDVVIDSNGSFFSIIKNNIGNLVYKFEYSLASAVAGAIVETENQVFSQSTNPIVKWYLRATGNPKDSNAMFVDRVVGTVTDEAQLYRVVLGDSVYPILQNATMTLVNILPTAVATSAKTNFFAQVAFKYRSSNNSNVSSNTGYIRYLELNKNEITPVGPDDTYMFVDNISAGFGAVHDSLTTDASYALVRGRNVRFVGKTSMDQLYSGGSINNANQYMDVVVDVAETRINAPGLFTIRALSGELALKASQAISFDSTKNFFKSALYVGLGNYSSGNNYAPTNGAVIQGAVGIGYAAAPTRPSSMNAMLSVGGDVYMTGTALAFGGTDGNLDHVWFDDNGGTGFGGMFHLVADAAYKTIGNAGLQLARLFSSYRADVTSGISIGPQGWRNGPEDGSLSVYGQGYFRTDTYVDGKFFGRANAEFNGTVGMETNNFYTRASSQVDIRGGASAFIGSPGINYSIWRHYNNNSGAYEYIGFRGDHNDWRLSQGGLERTLWHSGNDGSGSGLDADLLDGVQATGFWRKNTEDSGSFMQFRGQDVGGALYLHQDNGSATQIQRWYFGNTLMSYMQVDGTMYAQTFYILSDEKLKKDIRPISTAMDFIKKLNPVHFKWKDGIRDQGEQSGFIAQEVEKVLPNMVRPSVMGLSMSNSDLIPFLVKGLQEAFAEIERLKNLIK